MENNQIKAKEINFDQLSDADEAYFKNFKISLADYPLILMFGFLFAIVFLQFFTRYILNDSIAWTEEAARYLLILVTFAGAIRCQITGSHITLEFMDKYYGRFKNWFIIFSLLLTLIFISLIIWSALVLIERTSFQQMVSLPFPKYYLHAIVVALLSINWLVLIYLIYNKTCNSTQISNADIFNNIKQEH